MSPAFDPRRPALVERTPISVDGVSGDRLLFIFCAVGCGYARRPGGGCSNCGFHPLSTQGAPLSDADLIAQFDSALGAPGALDGVVEVDLFNSGSFLADAEISPAVRAHALAALGRSGVKRVLIESRPEFVTADKVAAACALVGAQRLEVGIGLESADDRVREQLVNKGFGRAEFEAAVAVLARTGARLLAYLLLKPLGLDERAAIEDAVASARYVFDLARRLGAPARVALQPVFVAPGTALEREYRAGRYRSPSLWSAIEAVQRISPLGELLVGMSDEGLQPHLAPQGCERCTPRLRAALIEFNRTGDATALAALDCECRATSGRATGNQSNGV
ncbi:MAG: hypothetical protein JXR83_05535 [Deltaproteobacteria bacterium]|nr:hypothetical protein [Deltaproteobacteria bacterium]